MTVADSTVRRSQRSTATVRSSQYVSDVSDIDGEISEEHQLTQSDNDDDDDDDDDYGTTSSKRKVSTRRSSNKKKRRISKKNKVPLTVEDVEDFVESYIFQALSATDISIDELATNWIEDYEASSTLALKDLINFVLRCCGCVLQIQEHDVDNNESAAETIGEIQQVFINQQIHEYPLNTTNSKWKNFKQNVLDFISNILSIADEKDILYHEEGALMENLLIWLSALSTSQLRPLRYCSTIILLKMETTLCELSVKTANSFEKQQRQFEIESKKLKDLKEKLEKSNLPREQSKIEKDLKKVEKRLGPINLSLASYKDQKTILEDYLKDILNTTFVHRYRDVDPKTREECMIALGQWIDILPEQFFETSYLRYFGWILSDKNAGVRLEVVKSLLKLYKKAVIVPGFRQFTERFKGRLIEMAIYDSDYSVRLSTLSLILEILKIGFLDEDDILKITSLIFCDRSNKMNLICTTENKYLRLQQEVSRVVQVAEIDQTKEFKEKFQGHIVNSEKQFSLDLNEMIRQKSLLQILEKSFLHFRENYLKLEAKQEVSASTKLINSLKMIYMLPAYESVSLFEFLYQYLVFDLSAVELVDPELNSKVELTTSDRSLLFSYMAAISTLLIESDLPQNSSILKLQQNSHKKKYAESGPAIADKDLIANKLISYLPQLFLIFKNNGSMETFIRLHILLLRYSEKQLDSMKMESLGPITEKILSLFRELEIDILDRYNFESFSELFASLTNGVNNITQHKTNLLVESLTAELSSELIFDLKKSSDLDPIRPLALTLNKLLIVGQSIDISDSLDLQENDNGDSIISLLCNKCLKNEDSKRDEIDSLLLILKLFSCHISWKLENFFDKQRLLMSDTFVISNNLTSLNLIFSTVKEIALEDGLSELLKDETLKYISDLLVLMKSFHIKISEKLKNLESDEKLADLNSFFEITVPLEVDQSLAKKLLRTFLVKEHKWAKLNDIQLDRDEDEDVNFDTDEEDTSPIGQRIQIEDDLCKFTIKLLTLHKTGLLPINIFKRLSLNKDELESDLFKKLFVTLEGSSKEDQIGSGQQILNEAVLGKEQAEDNDVLGDHDIEMSL